MTHSIFCQIDSLNVVVDDTSFVNYYQVIAGALLGVLISALTTLIIFPSIQGKVDRFMVDILGSFRFRKKRTLSGKWTHQWHHQSVAYPNPSVATGVEVKHYRNLIKAKYEIIDLNGNTRTYRMLGKIDRDYITGTWEDEETGITYHGAFQLRVLPNATRMEGTWVGWSRNGTTQSGIWQWTRN